MRRSSSQSLALGLLLGLVACTPRDASTPAPSAREAGAPSVAPGPLDATAADGAPSASASVPAALPPSPFTLVTEVDGDYTALFPVVNGVALYDSDAKGARLRIARGAGATATFAPVAAVAHLPEMRAETEAMFIGEVAENDLIISLSTDGKMGTVRINAAGTTRRPGTWFRAVGRLPGGGAVVLPSKASPIYLADPTPQKLETLAPATMKFPALPADLRLYELDVLPSGELHALGARSTDAGIEIVGWVAPVGGAARTLVLPIEPGDQPHLVKGSLTFLATGDRSLIGEASDGHVRSRPIGAFDAGAGDGRGEVWFAENVEGKPSTLRHGKLDGGDVSRFVGTQVALPSAAQLAAMGAHGCKDLGSVHQTVALSDGTVWLRVACGGGGFGIFKASF